MPPRPLPVRRILLPTPFTVGPVNAYLIDAEPLTLVDCGPKTDEAWRALREGLESAGRRLQSICRLVLTHPHHDHSGLARRVQEVSACSVHAHPVDHPRLRDAPGEWERDLAFLRETCRRAGVPRRFLGALDLGLRSFRQYGERLDHVEPFADGDELEFEHHRVSMLHTPGHSRGGLSLWEAATRALVSGDTVLPHISSNAILEPSPRGFRQRTLVDYIATLRRLAGLSVRWVLPGHGEEMGGPSARGDVLSPLVSSRLEFYERRAAQILDLVRHGLDSPWEVAARLFPKGDPAYVFLEVSEVVGHLDLLAARGEIAFEGQEGEWRVMPSRGLPATRSTGVSPRSASSSRP